LAAAAAGPPSIVFGALPGLDTAGLADAVGPGITVAEPEPGRYRVEGPAAAGPQATAAVATWLAGRGITLTDLATGRSLEDVYFEVVGARAAEPAAEAEPTPSGGRRRRRGPR
jgi:ABC-2 type transport system ATP-binding protein